MGAHHRWTAEEDALLLSLSRREAGEHFPRLNPWVVERRYELLRAGRVKPGEPRRTRAGTLTHAQRAEVRAAPPGVTNTQLAERFGVTRQAISVLRGRRREHRRRWTRAEDRLVRTLRPAEAAARTGRTRGAVLDRRRALGLTTPRPAWTPAEDALVRNLPAAEAAERTGRPVGAVRYRRAALGVTRPPRGRWTAEEDALVRALSLAQAVARTGRTRFAVAKRRQLLGVARRYKPRR